VLVDDISPDKLEDLGFDAYVSTACPRIALDDSDRYKRQIATPTELLIALGEMRWEDYLIDEWGFAMQEKRK
jgi:2-(3-amino-3-carboxypropyl)histidine synthase